MPTTVKIGVGPVRVNVSDHRHPAPQHHGHPHGHHHGHHYPRPPVVVVAPPVYYPAPPYGPTVHQYADRVMGELDANRDGWIHVNEPYDYRQRDFLQQADARGSRPDGWVNRHDVALAVRDRIDFNRDRVVDASEQRWAQVNFGF